MGVVLVLATAVAWLGWYLDRDDALGGLWIFLGWSVAAAAVVAGIASSRRRVRSLSITPARGTCT